MSNTLLHEGGHAFHCLAARDEPLVFLRSAPMEFCEVASMSMELLGSDHFDVFYTEAEAARAKRDAARGHHPLPPLDRDDRFIPALDLHPSRPQPRRSAPPSGCASWIASPASSIGPATKTPRAALWQRQLTSSTAPFYYIEYGIAQLGALQLWLKSRHDPHGALAGYRAALALGGTRTLPELFAAAGISFDFSPKTLRPLMSALREELDQLPT